MMKNEKQKFGIKQAGNPKIFDLWVASSVLRPRGFWVLQMNTRSQPSKSNTEDFTIFLCGFSSFWPFVAGELGYHWFP